MLLIVAVNESTVLGDKECFNIAWACDYQLHYHFGRSGWRSDVSCQYRPGGVKAVIPAGASILHLLDTSDQPGALGYHDEDGNEVPYVRAFAKTTQDDGESVSAMCSHECTELAADPHVNLSALTGDMKHLYALEVGDPVQGSDYDVGAPQGKALGVQVANFALPAYFDPNTTSERVDFRGVLTKPFTIAPRGYMSYIDTSNFTAGWQQHMGAERTEPVTDKDDRVARRVS